MPRLDAVDLSEFNPTVEYEKLHRDGCRYAWIRVFSGVDFDPMRSVHREACQKVGILAFPYWVANPMRDANSEGGLARQHCESAVWDTVDGASYWALDWEEAGLNLAWAQRFGQPPVLYRSFAHENVYPDAKQWIADWGLQDPPMVKNLVAWQYTDALTGYRSDGGKLDASEAFIHTPQPDHTPGGKVDQTHYEKLHQQLDHQHKHLVAIGQALKDLAHNLGHDIKLDTADLAVDTAPESETPAGPGTAAELTPPAAVSPATESPAPATEPPAEAPAPAEPAEPAAAPSEAPTAPAETTPPAETVSPAPVEPSPEAGEPSTPVDDAGGTPDE